MEKEMSVKELVEFLKKVEDAGYGDFKIKVGQAVAEVIEPIRQEKNKLLADKDYLDKVMSNGAERAERLAYRTLNKVYRKVGLVARKRGI